ncbi:MAG: T9SS type A sorting domain-containing protein [Flavobacteriales bacterium]|nr:T9SS type A sorting domain-containing protein [Flavobacteriales bacterium]
MDDEAPGAQATGGTLTCTNTCVTLSGSGNGDFAWTGPNNYTSNEQNPTVCAAGTYVLTVTGANGCTSQANAEVDVDDEAPGAIASGGTLTCANGSVMLLGVGNGSYAWSGPNNYTSTEQNPVVTVAGTYMLTVTGANGCTSEASAEVDLDEDVPGANATGGSITCDNDCVTLAGGGNGSFAWSGPNNYTSNEQNPTVCAAGSYELTVTGANGCTSMATAIVELDTDAPGAEATGGSITCDNDCVTLAGGGNGSFAWSGPNNFTSDEQNPTVCAAGSYELTVTGANGCTSMATAVVALDTEAPFASTQDATLGCSAETVAINATVSAGAGIVWMGPDNFTSTDEDIIVSALGLYTLTATGANGCMASASAFVSLGNDTPEISLIGGTLTCSNQSVTIQATLDPTGFATSWSGPNGFTSTDEDPVVTEEGTYTLTATSINGCTTSASVDVLQDADVPGAQASGGTITCTNACVMLTASGNGTYAWSGPNNFVSNEQNPTVCEAGTYTLVVTGANGCASSASTNVWEDTGLPGASAQGGTLTCTIWSVTLNGGGDGSFSWSGPNGFSSSDEDPTVFEPGTYTLTVTGLNGCTSTATAIVDQDIELPQATVYTTYIGCNGEPATLSYTSSSTITYDAWAYSVGIVGNGPTHITSIPGTYTLVLEGPNGCVNEFPIEVMVDPNCEDECGPLIIWCPPDITVQCAEDWSPFGVAGEPELRKDKKCPELVDVGWTDVILSNCPYVIQRTFWAEDAEGHYEECMQLITVIDEVAPIFMEVPQDITLQCSADIDGCELPSVWAYDECTKQNICAVHTSEVVLGECANNYDIVHTWTATDQCGNTGTATWTVHVVDTEAPELECPVQDISVTCDAIPEPMKCKATDNCDPDVAVEYTEEKGGFDEDCKYVLTRTYTATDDCGNSASVVQYITVWCPKACKKESALTAKMDVSATPNPFRHESMIGFTPLTSGKATVEITDMQGRKVAELFNGQVERDVPVKLTFKPVDGNGGIYLYRVTLNGEVQQGRMLYQP